MMEKGYYSLSGSCQCGNKFSSEKDLLYRLLLISSIIGYWIHVPKYNKIYLFHLMLFIYIVNELFNLMFGKQKISVNGYSFKYILFLLIWYCYIVMSYFWSESFSLYLQFTIIYTIMLSFTIVIICNNQNISQLELSFDALGLIFIMVVAIGLLEAFKVIRLPNSPYARDFTGIYKEETIGFLKSVPTVFFGNPNDLGTYLSLSISFLFSFIAFESNTKRKGKLIAILSASIVVLIFTYSRANIVAICIAYLSYLLITDKKRFRNILISMIIITVIIVIGMFFQDKLPLQFKSITNIFKILRNLKNKSDNSINTRVFIVEQTLMVSKKNVLGLGAGNMRHYLGTVAGSNITDPHNWWMELLSEFGLFIFIFYLTFYAYLVLKLLLIAKDKTINNELRKYAAGSFIALNTLIISATSPSSIVYFIPHWILMGISISVISIYGKEKRN